MGGAGVVESCRNLSFVILGLDPKMTERVE